MPGQLDWIENENFKVYFEINWKGQPQTEVDSELQPMFAGPAPYVANAVLTAGIQFYWTLLTKYCHSAKHLSIPCTNALQITELIEKT